MTSETDKINILLVDDQPANLLALESILDEMGQNLVRADSGSRALKELLDREFAVILLDVQMPDLDGFETASLIRERERSKDTPIIFLTALSRSEVNVFLGYELGAVDYIFKPFTPTSSAPRSTSSCSSSGSARRSSVRHRSWRGSSSRTS